MAFKLLLSRARPASTSSYDTSRAKRPREAARFSRALCALASAARPDVLITAGSLRA